MRGLNFKQDHQNLLDIARNYSKAQKVRDQAKRLAWQLTNEIGKLTNKSIKNNIFNLPLENKIKHQGFSLIK